MGFFLTIEGGEGAGKSTAINAVLQWLNDHRRTVVHTREPGGTPLAESLRELLLAHHDETVSELTELLMVFAGRRQHLINVIEPALTAGHIVLCDRFTDATYAYQGGGRGLNAEHIALLETLVQDERRPDMTLLLDVDPEVGMARMRSRAEAQGGTPDRIEVEEMAFFHRVRNTYLQRAAQFPQQYVIIDANRSIEQVQQQIAQALDARLNG